jgi:tetratricopeptide (TPR) repeat protein
VNKKIMAIVSTFIGRSFDKTDEPLWIEISKFLDSLKKVGFEWEDAEEGQARPISDKVKEKIARNDMFIGILLKRDIVCSKRFPLWWEYHVLKTINWTTSYWVIQESGYAIGKGKKVVFLIEDGLEIPGGLNADFEYVIIYRNNLSITFTKLNEIITNEISLRVRYIEEQSGLKSVEVLSPQKSVIQEQEKIADEKTLNFVKVIEAINSNDYSLAEKIFNELLQQDQFKDEGLKTTAHIFYYTELYLSGRNDAFNQLKKIADENPENYLAVQSLIECLQFYDKYKEAKETVESYLKVINNYDTKLSFSLLLSSISVKLKEFENAKENLFLFFINSSTNSNEQNFQIYKLLGDIYKEQGDLEISCSLYEMALNYEPTELSIRFRLAYDYDEIKKYALSAYHYKTYLKTSEDSTAMNNLGWEYERLKLFGKSVWAYRKAMNKDETLANSNLARLYIEKGFYDEARNILDNALEKKEHHGNVDYYLNHLKTSIEKEEKDEESLLKGTQESRAFILDYAQAIAVPFNNYAAITGLWITDYKDLKELKIQFVSPNILAGEHEVKYTSAIPYRMGLLAYAHGVAKQETITRIKKITFSGKIINRRLRYSVKVSSDSESLLTSALRTEFTGFGILSQDNQEIKFIVEKEGEFEYFTAKKSVKI